MKVRGVFPVGIILILLLAVSSSFAQQYEDVVYLKDGGVRRGLIHEQIPGESVKLKTAYGEIFIIKISDISKIVKEEKGVPIAEPASKIDNAPRVGSHELEISLRGYKDALDGDGGATLNQVGYGYFFNDVFELKSRVVFNAGSGVDWGVGFALIPVLHIPVNDRLNAFFSVGFGFGIDESYRKSQKSMALSTSLGVKVFSKGGGGSINIGPYLAYIKGFNNGEYYGWGYDLMQMGFSTSMSLYF